jgi:mRNA interferase MazF
LPKTCQAPFAPNSRFDGAQVKSGELYRVYKPGGDPRQYRRFVICSRQILLDSRFSTVVYAPVFIHGEGLSTQVLVGPDEGLKHPGWIMCDNLVSLRKLTSRSSSAHWPGRNSGELDQGLKMALDLS